MSNAGRNSKSTINKKEGRLILAVLFVPFHCFDNSPLDESVHAAFVVDVGMFLDGILLSFRNCQIDAVIRFFVPLVFCRRRCFPHCRSPFLFSILYHFENTCASRHIQQNHGAKFVHFHILTYLCKYAKMVSQSTDRNK